MIAGKYQPYSEYQDAQSKWLDSIPNHWVECRLKQIVSERVTDGPHETPKFEDEGVPFLSAEAVKERQLDFSRRRGFISRELHEVYSKKCLPRRGDIFMVKSGATTGALAMVETDEEFNIWSPLAVVRSNKSEAADRFVFYSMQADFFQRSVQLSWSYGTQPNIGMGVIENLYIARAPLEEQIQIAKFLDYETAKIDALIEKQQQLIALLKEKRQAVISHAVTKGLNPDAPMRDSGVEWLGEVPAHWEVKRLSHLGELQNGLNIGGDAFGSGDPFVSYGDVYNNTIVPTLPAGLVQSTADDQRKYSLKDGDVLFTRTSETVDDIGVASTCLQEIPRVTFAGFLIRFRPFPCTLNSSYSSFLFRNQSVQAFFCGSMNLVTRASLSQNVLKTLPICVPPIDEQIRIATHLEETATVFDQLENNLVRLGELLAERRTALISAAVTGRIDVRGWQHPETECGSVKSPAKKER